MNISSFYGNLETDYDREYSDSQLLKRYFQYAKNHKKFLYRTIVAILVSTFFTLLLPFPLQIAVDGIIDNKENTVINMAVLFMLIYIIIWVADFFRAYENTRFTANSTNDIRKDLFVKLQKHDLSFYDKQNTGLLQSRIMDDTQVLADFVKITGDFFVNSFIAIGTAMILIYIDPRLSLLAFSVVPFLIALAIIFRKFARSLSRDWRISVSKLNDSFAENISGISVARSFGRETESWKDFNQLNQVNRSINIKKQMFFSSIFPFVFALSNLGLFLVLYEGGLQSIRTGSPSPGTILLYLVLLQRFYFPVVLITTYAQQVQAGMAAAERIFSLMDVESKVHDSGKKVLGEVSGALEFRDVSFQYDEGVKVFSNFNLKINPGEKIALVGHTGSGKSTLISLILRFYKYSGQITIDDENIDNYTLNSYRSKIGLVTQEPQLFSGSIRKNVVYGKKSATPEEITNAIKMANAEEIIERFPDGLETEILERGKRLSQGQKQLISLSRAFLINPSILLLDEATASIDAYSEALIQEAIERILTDRTSIIIAHRLTTVKRADRIIVLDHGKIVEVGSHNDLLMRNGLYATLYNQYFAFQEVNL